jgi:hypothetical protein
MVVRAALAVVAVVAGVGPPGGGRVGGMDERKLIEVTEEMAKTMRELLEGG